VLFEKCGKLETYVQIGWSKWHSSRATICYDSIGKGTLASQKSSLCVTLEYLVFMVEAVEIHLEANHYEKLSIGCS